MSLETLEYILWKQRDIVHQLADCKDKIEHGKPIEIIGDHDIHSPQELLNFHKERYSILEVAKNCSENVLRDWIGCARKRLADKNDFRTLAEIALLEGCLDGKS